MNKLKSRKFWIAVASMLASIGAAVAGLAIDNQAVTIAGSICTIVSGAIYSFCESYVDGVRAGYMDEEADCFIPDDEDEVTDEVYIAPDEDVDEEIIEEVEE